LATCITLQAIEAERKIVGAIKLARTAQPSRYDDKQLAARKAEMLQNIREGIAINPHYRALTAAVADNLMASGDWENAVWILESMATSRPHVLAIWSSLASGYTYLGQNSQALQALRQLQRLQAADAPGTRALEVVLLSRTGHGTQAAHMLNGYFNQGGYDYDLVQVGYSLGLAMRDWPLAIRSLELRNQNWPEQAADGYLRLGKIYANPEVHDETKALDAFRAGLQAVPPEQKDDFRSHVPESYRIKL
jgi:tetratricopeptide (TPR) repeat protein